MNHIINSLLFYHILLFLFFIVLLIFFLFCFFSLDKSHNHNNDNLEMFNKSYFPRKIRQKNLLITIWNSTSFVSKNKNHIQGATVTTLTISTQRITYKQHDSKIMLALENGFIINFPIAQSPLPIKSIANTGKHA